MCDQTALYRVHSLGFCKEHAQAAKLIPSDGKVRYYKRLHMRMTREAIDAARKNE